MMWLAGCAVLCCAGRFPECSGPKVGAAQDRRLRRRRVGLDMFVCPNLVAPCYKRGEIYEEARHDVIPLV